MTEHLDQIEQGIMSGVMPEHQASLEQIVVAGKRVLYDPKTHEQVFKEIEDIGEDSDPRNVAIGVAGLLTLLKQDVRKKFPDDVIIPAGALLTVEVMRFLADAEMLEVTPEFTGNAVEEFLAIMMQKMDLGPQQPQQEQQMQRPEIPGGISPSPRQGMINGAMA